MARTWAQIRDQIKDDYNLQGELFVSDQELLAWANDAIEEAEKEIVSLHDKYFETSASLALVSGQDLYSLPSDIMGNKITGIYYDNGSTYDYEIEYIKTKKRLLNISENSDYGYRLVNSTANGIQLKLFPASRESSTDVVTIHYVRQSVRLSADSDTIDIPLAENFVKQYIKDKVKEKEIGPMNVQSPSPLLEKQRQLMIEALNDMIPDETRNQIRVDDDEYYENYDEYDFY